MATTGAFKLPFYKEKCYSFSRYEVRGCVELRVVSNRVKIKKKKYYYNDTNENEKTQYLSVFFLNRKSLIRFSQIDLRQT